MDIIGPSSCREVVRIDGNVDGMAVLRRRPHRHDESPIFIAERSMAKKAMA